MTEISDTIPGPSIDTGDDLVDFIERFTNEIQEPPTNQTLISPPILQPDSSQFLLANIVGHGSTSDLLEPLLSPVCETDKLLSDVLFQESDPCTHSNPPSPYLGSESQELIAEQTADIIMENDSVSIEGNISIRTVLYTPPYVALFDHSVSQNDESATPWQTVSIY